MKLYAEIDNKLNPKKDPKKDKKSNSEKKNNTNGQSIAESYGLSKDARILME